MYKEIERLNAVKRFKEPNESVTKELNDLVNLAAEICETPVALTTLLDEDVQWFKASKGVDIDCTGRDIAFCNYTIKGNDLLMVPDMLEDERFKNNALVAGDPNVRFYAGVSLITVDGHAIGSLCVLDFQPRTLDARQQYSLTVLARQVVNLLELNWSLSTLAAQHEETRQQKIIIEDSEMKLNAIFNSSKDIYILAGKQLEVLAFNRAASGYVYTTNKKLLKLGDHLPDFFDPGIVKSLNKYFSVALSGRPIKKEWMMWPGTKHACWKETEMIPVKNQAGEVIGVALNSTDITDRKLQEKRIRIQNEALTRIAIIQSHELRRPVASLIGLLDLIKMEQSDGSGFTYLDLLELTVQELDMKIRGIVKDSEETISNSPLKIVA